MVCAGGRQPWEGSGPAFGGRAGRSAGLAEGRGGAAAADGGLELCGGGGGGAFSAALCAGSVRGGRDPDPGPGPELWSTRRSWGTPFAKMAPRPGGPAGAEDGGPALGGGPDEEPFDPCEAAEKTKAEHGRLKVRKKRRRLLTSN